MEMIIGGAYQGKLALARRMYPDIEFCPGTDLTREELLHHCSGVSHLENFIRRELERGADVSTLAEELLAENPALVLICDEVGSGVVPMDRLDRQYREAVGRICTKLAAGSRRVIRVMCGIPTVIKEREE